MSGSSQTLLPALSPADQALNDSFAQYVQPELQQEKYGTDFQQLAAGVEGFGSGATFGLTRHAENYFGIPMEEQLARKKAGWTGTAGDLLGAGAMLGLTRGLGGVGKLGANMLGLGAESAAKVAGETALAIGEEAGLVGKELIGSVNLARQGALAEYSAASRIGSKVLATGIENAVYTSGDETVKHIFGDGNETLGNSLAHIGASGLFGAGLGLVSGAGRELWGLKHAPEVQSSLDEIDKNFNGGPGEVPEYKPNAQDILRSSSRLGVEPTQGMLDKDSLSGHMESELAKGDSVVSRNISNKMGAIKDAVADHSKDLLKEATDKSEGVIGKEARESLYHTLEKKRIELSNRFDALESHTKNMELTASAKAEAAAPLLVHPFVAEFPDSSIAKEATKIAGEIGTLQNVNSVKIYRTMLNGEINKAVMSGDNNLMSVLNLAKQSLTGLEERGIGESALAIAGKEGNKIAAGTIGEIRQVRADYAAYKNLLSELGVATKLGKKLKPSGLLDDIKVSSESIPSRLFDVNNVERMRFIKETFPKEYQLSRRAALADIKEKSLDYSQGGNRAFSTQRFLTQVRKLSPEVREELFPGQSQRLNDLNVVQGALPGSFNTSNTAAALGLLTHPIANGVDLIKLGITKILPHMETLVKNSGDSQAGKIAALKIAASGSSHPSAEAFKTMVDYISQAIKGENVIGKAVKAVIDGESVKLPQKINDEKREKLDKQLVGFLHNPDQLYGVGGDLGHYMPGHQVALARTAAGAASYLNSIRPTPEHPNPLDEEVPVSKEKEEEWNNALDIASQPLLVVNKIKDGTLVPQDVMHLKSIYPALYDNLSAKLSEGIIDAVHDKKDIPYHTKMSISLFTGQPLDSTMTPEGIMSAQPKGLQTKNGHDTMPTQGPHSMKNIKNMASNEATPAQARAGYRSNGRV